MSVPESMPDIVGLTEQAEAGDPAAQFGLGLLLFLGSQGPPDKPRAIRWWEKAAESGWREAEFMLGQCYHFGMEKKAQYSLALMYLTGVGVEHDDVRAVGWLTKSAQRVSSWPIANCRPLDLFTAPVCRNVSPPSVDFVEADYLL